MYGQYHLPRGKNPALSCLIGFVSMDRAKQQNYSTIQYKWQFTGPSCRLLLRRKSGALAFINLLVPFADMWDIKLPGPRAIPEYSAEQPGWSTQSWRRRSNEQWGVKSQSCTFPAVKLEGRSNHHFTRCWIRFSLIFFNLTTCCFCRCSASCGTRIGLVKHWHVGPHVSKPPGQRPPKIRNLPRHPRGKITSFLLILIL